MNHFKFNAASSKGQIFWVPLHDSFWLIRATDELEAEAVACHVSWETYWTEVLPSLSHFISCQLTIRMLHMHTVHYQINSTSNSLYSVAPRKWHLLLPHLNPDAPVPEKIAVAKTYLRCQRVASTPLRIEISMAVAALQWDSSFLFSVRRCPVPTPKCRRHAVPSCVWLRSGGWSWCWCFAKFETTWKNIGWTKSQFRIDQSIQSTAVNTVIGRNVFIVLRVKEKRLLDVKYLGRLSPNFSTLNWKEVWCVQVTHLLPLRPSSYCVSEVVWPCGAKHPLIIL